MGGLINGNCCCLKVYGPITRKAYKLGEGAVWPYFERSLNSNVPTCRTCDILGERLIKRLIKRATFQL